MSTRCTYDPTTGIVTIRTTANRRNANGKRRRMATGLVTIHRDRLRNLCDDLHDYADELDHEDRAAAHTVGASESRDPDAQKRAPAVNCLRTGGYPIARASEMQLEVNRG